MANFYDTSSSDVEKVRLEKVTNAAKNGDVALLTNLIESGYPVNLNYKPIFNKAEYNPLYQAVENNQHECAKLLIEHGADVNFESFLHHTPLHAAVTTENPQLVTLLLENGGTDNINLFRNDWSDSCPIFSFAAQNGSVEIAKVLIEFGADVNILGGWLTGGTPLTYAAEAGHLDMVNFLIENGADVNTFSPQTFPSSLFISAYYSSSLFNAMNPENPEIVKALLDAGANDLGWSPLHTAIATQDFQLAEQVIHQNDALTNTSDALGLYPIQYGVLLGSSTDILDLLVDNGANVNVSYHDEELGSLMHSILHLSAAMLDSSPEVFSWCIEHVENIDCFNPTTHETTLGLACIEGNTMQAQMLLEHGANPNHQNEQGQTPLTESINSTEHTAQAEFADLLITFGADVNLQDKDGLTALHHEVNHLKTGKPSSVELIDLLIDNGADPNITTNEGETALDLATKASNSFSDYPTEILSILNTANLSHTDAHTADLGIDTHVDTTTTTSLTTSDVFDNSNSNSVLNTLANLKDNAPSTDAAANIASLGALDSIGFIDPLNAHFDTHYVATTPIDNLLHGDDVVASEY